MTDKKRIIAAVERWLPLAIILAGIVLRLTMLLQNRCLWIDEASVARNIFERGFLGLALPLNYFQYAPPVYLWLVKLSATLFGYSEYALRFYSFLSGIGCLFLFYVLAKRAVGAMAAMYPLFLLATGFIYLQYATELKQYVPDAFISLLLMWLALREKQQSPGRFALTWLLAGSVAIWASMPSVFVLLGVGAYLGLLWWRRRHYSLPLLLGIGAVWLLQFLLYYLLLLKPQILSDHLQNYHHRFFLFGTPANTAEWQHNTNMLRNILSTAGGGLWYAQAFHALLLLLGTAWLLRKDWHRAVLLWLPIVAMLAAAVLNHYSLIPRLTLFAMPLVYLLMAYGLRQLLGIGWLLPRMAVVLLMLLCGWNYQSFSIVKYPYKAEEITRGLQFLKRKGIEGKDIFVGVGAEHAWLYYTGVHPGKDRWQKLRGATMLPGSTNFDSLAATIHTRKALLYTIVFDSYDGKKKLDRQLHLADSFHTEGCHVFIYEPR